MKGQWLAIIRHSNNKIVISCWVFEIKLFKQKFSVMLNQVDTTEIGKADCFCFP